MWTKLKRVAVALLKGVTPFAALAGLWLGLLTYLFNKTTKENEARMAAQQQQQEKLVEETKARITEAQGVLQKNQFAANMIPSLVKGSDKEKELALYLLEGVDKTLWIEMSKRVAERDPSPTVRQQAIAGLAKRGDALARPALIAIQQQAKTPTEREDAKQGAEILTDKFKANLSQARAFYGVGRWKDAAYYFYEASKFLSSSEVNTTDLALAKTDYEHGGYQEAARSFKALFSKF